MMDSKVKSSLGVRVLVLFLLAFAGLVVVSVATLILNVMEWNALQLSVLLQDFLVFIVPAIVTAAVYYRHPHRLLAVDRAPSWPAVAMVLCVCLASLPAMNWLVDWNENLHLPSSMAALEQSIRNMEAQAQEMSAQLIDATTVTGLLAALALVGLMAGLSEELFFRGALMGIMRQSKANVHLVIWTVAFVFSAIHMQFLGFVPRLLLGAWMGYLLAWSRSLWVSFIAHTLNNSMVVIAAFLANRGVVSQEAFDTIGIARAGGFPWLAAASVAVTAALIVATRKILLHHHTKNRSKTFAN